MSDLSKTKRIEVVNLDWEWVDESKEVIESITAPRGVSSSFNFVAENGVSRPRGEKPRKLIRAHATRHGRATNHSNGKIKTKKEIKTDVKTDIQTVVKTVIRNPILLNRFPRCTTLDPFKTLPGGETSETSFLLEYYTQFPNFDPFKPLPGSPTPESNAVLGNWVAEQTLPELVVGPTSTWLSFAKAEPALFHVTLLLAGIRLSSSFPSPLVRVALLYQRGEAIKGVSKYLEAYHAQKSKSSSSTTNPNSRPREEVKWTIVCTVAALAQADSALAMRESCLEHLSGLELLVEERGGLEVFENFWGGRARRYLEWTDLNASLLMETTPKFAKKSGGKPTRDANGVKRDLPSRSAD